jgi:predicted nucleic acid-binding protein
VKTLVDSNVILDTLTEDPVWAPWSSAALVRAADEGVLLVNPIVYAEVSVYIETIEEVDEALAEFEYCALPREAAFLASKAHQMYRENGGTRRSPLPDLFIGAHAMVTGCRVLTRDPRRFRTYYPKLEVIAPPNATLDRDP